MNDVATALSLCILRAGDELFGIETQEMHEVLGKRTVHAVPLAPEFVAGVISYRGDVLMVVCLRKLLGMAPRHGPPCVIVLRDECEGELFGLAVDSAENVVTVDAAGFEENDGALDKRRRALFSGTYEVRGERASHLKPELLWPMKLMELFRSGQ